MTSSVAAVWGHRGVLRLLVQRDLTVKYQQSVLGYIWSLIEPLGMGLIYYFVFGVLYGERVGPAHASYPLFVLTGVFAWMWVSSSLNESTSALTGQARLITTMKVPREVFPIGRVIGRFAEYLAGVPILIIAAILFDGDFGWNMLALPLALMLQAILLTGISLLLSSLNVLLRDVERLMRLAQRALFYAAPIIYPLSRVQQSDVPEWVKTLYEINPLVGIFQLHHAAWIANEWPPNWLLITSAAGCLIVLLSGWWVFRRLEPAVLKEL
ncbi:ABC transporter permease [Rhizomonospora bruguierae]|uniref:ABC transporter permease n=1 Tax=Rhizomonospora bruguierae TaxID=1581705 RepID=UPI001BD05AA8|nr:ABC transporter permease [Micromonospora sp. NBRC 107566]